MILFSSAAPTSYRFNFPGTYRIVCENDPSFQATVSVPSVPTPQSLLPLLYSHVALMIAAFGVLLPVGGFLAHHQVKLVHKVVQPLGVLLGLIGLVLVVVYVQLTHGRHFKPLIHAVVGLVLLLLAAVGMPLLLFRKERTWHKKCGQIVVFFGLANVLLVSFFFEIPDQTLCCVTVYSVSVC